VCRAVLVRFVTRYRKHDRHLVSAEWKNFITYTLCLQLTPRGLYELHILLFTAARPSWVAHLHIWCAWSSYIALWRNTLKMLVKCEEDVWRPLGNVLVMACCWNFSSVLSQNFFVTLRTPSVICSVYTHQTILR